MGVKIEVDCPQCGTVYKITARAEGDLLKCKKCQCVIDLNDPKSSRKSTSAGRKAGTGRRGRPPTNRKGRTQTGRQARTEGGGRRARKKADVWPMVAVGGFVLFAAIIALIIFVSSSGGPPPAATTSRTSDSSDRAEE